MSSLLFLRMVIGSEWTVDSWERTLPVSLWEPYLIGDTHFPIHFDAAVPPLPLHRSAETWRTLSRSPRLRSCDPGSDELDDAAVDWTKTSAAAVIWGVEDVMGSHITSCVRRSVGAVRAVTCPVCYNRRWPSRRERHLGVPSERTGLQRSPN